MYWLTREGFATTTVKTVDKMEAKTQMAFLPHVEVVAIYISEIVSHSHLYMEEDITDREEIENILIIVQLQI